MSIIEAVILAIVEGLTEFLPVSSTGHMILAEGIMGMPSSEYLKAFTVMIQLGAILSVVALYYKNFFRFAPSTHISMTQNRVLRFLSRFSFYWKLLVALIPSVIVGVLFEDYVDALLSNVVVVAVMLILVGIFMLFVDKIFARSQRQEVNFKNAWVIGVFQCIALIPGVSRSFATITGGLQQGLNRRTAAEFSFFLAVPTMLGATILKGYKLYQGYGIEIFRENLDTLLVGNIVAFIVGLLAIKFFISFLTKYGFKWFGYYRIILGMVVLILIFCGVPLTIN